MTEEMQTYLNDQLDAAATSEEISRALVSSMKALIDCQRKTAERVKGTANASRRRWTKSGASRSRPTYEDGYVFEIPMRPRPSAHEDAEAADPALPERLRAAREKRQRELAVTNTVTVETTGNAADGKVRQEPAM